MVSSITLVLLRRTQFLLHLEERWDINLLARAVRRRSDLRVEDADVGHGQEIRVYREGLYIPQEGYALLPHHVSGLIAIVEQRVILPLRYDALRLDDLPVASFLYRRPTIDGSIRGHVAAFSDEAVFLANILRQASLFVKVDLRNVCHRTGRVNHVIRIILEHENEQIPQANPLFRRRINDT
jgi:hypothetical protein